MPIKWLVEILFLGAGAEHPAFDQVKSKQEEEGGDGVEDDITSQTAHLEVF